MPANAAPRDALLACVRLCAAAMQRYDAHSRCGIAPQCACITSCAQMLQALLRVLGCADDAGMEALLMRALPCAARFAVKQNDRCGWQAWHDDTPAACISDASVAAMESRVPRGEVDLPSSLSAGCAWISASVPPFASLLSSAVAPCLPPDAVFRVATAATLAAVTQLSTVVSDGATRHVGVFNAILDADAPCQRGADDGPPWEVCDCGAGVAAHTLRAVSWASRASRPAAVSVASALAAAVSTRVSTVAVATGTLVQVVLMLQRLRNVVDSHAAVQVLSSYAAKRPDLSAVVCNACTSPHDGSELHADFIAGRAPVSRRPTMHLWGRDDETCGETAAETVRSSSSLLPPVAPVSSLLSHVVHALALRDGGLSRNVETVATGVPLTAVSTALALMRCNGRETVADLLALQAPPVAHNSALWRPFPTDGYRPTLASTVSSSNGQALDVVTAMLSRRATGGALTLLNAYSATVSSRWCASAVGDWALDEETVERFRARFPAVSHTLSHVDIALRDVGDGRRFALPTCDVIPVSDAYWPRAVFKSAEVVTDATPLTGALGGMVKALCDAFAAGRAPRYLSRKRLRGVVELQVESTETGETAVVRCSLLQALVMLHVAEATVSPVPVADLSRALGGVDVSAPVSFWVSHGYFKYDSALAVSLSASRDEDDPTPAHAAAAVEVGDDPAAVSLWRAYVANMLTAMGPLPLARVHAMMVMFASGGPHSFDKSELQCSRFLADMVRDDVIEATDGVYKMKARPGT